MKSRKRYALLSGLIGLVVLGAAIAGLGYNQPTAEVSAVEPTPIPGELTPASITIPWRLPGLGTAGGPTTTEDRPGLLTDVTGESLTAEERSTSSTETTTSDRPALERVVFTQVRSVAAP